MNRKELIEKYLEFFKSKGHRKIQNASLIPENDSTVLFTTAGMQPLVPFLLGQKHPLGKKLVGVQKCIRTKDIEEVGDSYHHTFFEMLGNWSLGDYFKKKAIEYSFELATHKYKFPIERLAVSVFGGNKNAPKDIESEKIWLSLGIPKERIAFLKNNWWELPEPGPCGPNTEVFFWKPNNKSAPKTFNPEDNNWVEIWNDVLMQYEKDKNGNYKEAKQKNIDNGRGLERILAVLQKHEDNYLTEIWQPIIEKIEEISGRKYKGNEKAMRIIADHIKAAIFIINDGVIPSNTEQGYVLRRLIRRAVKYGKELDLKNFTKELTEPVFKIYSDYEFNKEKIISELEKEEERFNLTLEKGLKIFEKVSYNKNKLDGKEAFLLYQSHGFPFEMIIEECNFKNIKFNPDDFKKELKKHQELSKTASAGRFKSGLADHSEQTTKLHTATHLLNEALRKVLKNPEISQKGSNITPERLRFDFNFPRKITQEEKAEIEKWVNQQIEKDLIVTKEEMNLKDAFKKGARGEFGTKYPEKVSVYTIHNQEDSSKFLSKEICTGPHVKRTSEIGRFKIIKEGSSSSGIRRIKAVLE